MGVYGDLSFDVVSAAKVVRLNLLIRGGATPQSVGRSKERNISSWMGSQEDAREQNRGWRNSGPKGQRANTQRDGLGTSYALARQLSFNRGQKGVKRAVLEAFQGCRWLRFDKHCTTVLPFDLTMQYLFAPTESSGLRVS